LQILIAEDERDITYVYREALENRGHSVSIVHDGEECLKIYSSNLQRPKMKHRKTDSSSFDLVILDYKMPKRDGIEVAEQILQWNPKQRIIFASAFVRETLLDYVKYLKRPVELIQKPFEVGVLLEMIEDKEIFDSVKNISDITREIKDIENPSKSEIRDLLEALRKAQKGKGIIY
jgi:CheY-like chemotaxis protein